MKTVPKLRVIEIQPRRSPISPGSVIDRVLLGAFLLLLMFGPLSFGVRWDWSQFVLRTSAAILFLVWAARQLMSERVKVIWSPILAPAAVFGLLLVAQSAIPLSAYPAVTLSETLNYCAYGALMFLAVQIVRRDSDAQWFAISIVVFGFLLACFAIVQNLSAPGMLYWVRKPLHGGAVYGSYVNRNHYAGLMEMIFPIALVMGLRAGDAAGKRAIWMFSAVVMLGSIVLSQSRGGMAASALEIIALTAYIARRHRTLALSIAGVAIVTAGFVVVSGRENALMRFGELGPRERLTIARDGMHMFIKHPVLGWGLETFPTVYPGFRSFYTDRLVNEAHNDYVQVLIETGIVGFGAVVAFLILLYKTGLRHLRRWDREPLTALRLAALAGCSGILVHSLVDFNLHIPPNAAMFYVLCGIAAGAGAVNTNPHASHHSMRHRVMRADIT